MSQIEVVAVRSKGSCISFSHVGAHIISSPRIDGACLQAFAAVCALGCLLGVRLKMMQFLQARKMLLQQVHFP